MLEWSARSLARRCLLAGALVLLLIPARGGARPAPTGTVVDLTLRDFSIRSTRSSVPSGPVTFRITNDAPDTHEFMIVRSDLPAGWLPLAKDGTSVDEESLPSLGEISEIDTQTTQTLTVSLTPGRYVYFCNLEGHYLGGMRASLEVTGDAPGS